MWAHSRHALGLPLLDGQTPKKPMMTNRQVQFCSLSITCFTIDNNNVISSSLRRIICPIHLNVSFAAGGCSSWIIATFASNTNVQNTSCKNRKSMNFRLGWSSSHKYRITIQFHTSSQTSAENQSANSTRRKLLSEKHSAKITLVSLYANLSYNLRDIENFHFIKRLTSHNWEAAHKFWVLFLFCNILLHLSFHLI